MHPLADSMARAQELGGFFALPQRQPDDPAWTDARNLFQGDDRRLEELVLTYGLRAWQSDNRHVACSAFLVAYLSRVVFPLVGQYVLERRVPDISLSNLSFHWNGPAIDATGLDRLTFAALPVDPAATHGDALEVADEQALYDYLKEKLFAENLDIVIASLIRAAGASLKVSRNAVAAALSQVLRCSASTASASAVLIRGVMASASLAGSPDKPGLHAHAAITAAARSKSPANDLPIIFKTGSLRNFAVSK